MHYIIVSSSPCMHCVREECKCMSVHKQTEKVTNKKLDYGSGWKA